MDERIIKQYEKLRKGYPQLFSDAHKIAKLIIRAHKEDMEPAEVWRYLQVLKKIESRKKGYRAVPDMVIDIVLDAKLTRDEEREQIKQYYRDVISFGHLKEYIIRTITKLDI